MSLLTQHMQLAAKSIRHLQKASVTTDGACQHGQCNAHLLLHQTLKGCTQQFYDIAVVQHSTINVLAAYAIVQTLTHLNLLQELPHVWWLWLVCCKHTAAHLLHQLLSLLQVNQICSTPLRRHQHQQQQVLPSASSTGSVYVSISKHCEAMQAVFQPIVCNNISTTCWVL
jgi:hypothetical protein